MKRQIIILVLIIFPLLTFAQKDTSDIHKFRHFDRGRNMASLQFSVGHGGNITAMNFQLRYGRFWIKKFNAGLQAGYSFSGSEYKQGSLGLFARYYFLDKKLSPFIETSYYYGLSTQNNKLEGAYRQQ